MSDTKLVRLSKRTTDQLEPLRKLMYSEGKLTYNHVVSNLLDNTVAVLKRRALCDKWICSGSELDLVSLIQLLTDVYSDMVKVDPPSLP